MADWGAGRLAEMDASGIDMQVLSMPAWTVHDMDDAEEALRLARKTNDTAAEAVQAHPARFAAFATRPAGQPNAAADELERTVKDLDFKGAMIPGPVRGRFLDDQFFWPIFERAQALDVRVAKNLKRRVAEYLQDNFYLTTSGYFSVAPLQCALAAVGANRILFAIDYPFADNAEGRAFLETAPISQVDREKIAHGNAERLLRIPPAAAGPPDYRRVESQ